MATAAWKDRDKPALWIGRNPPKLVRWIGRSTPKTQLKLIAQRLERARKEHEQWSKNGK